MTMNELLTRLQKLPASDPTVPASPPLELVALIVRWCRGMRQWKVSTLADFARVSTSTVERVERAQKVSAENLDRVAEALGYERGAFHEPRLPMGQQQAFDQMVETYSNMEAVYLRRLTTHAAVREATSCQAFLIHRPEVPETYDDDIHDLTEWLDFVTFAKSDFIVDGGEDVKRRELYDGVLRNVREMERRGLTVLCGAMDAPTAELPTWKVAIIAISPRLTDPGAVKRKSIMVDRRVVTPARARLLEPRGEAA